MAKQNSIDFNDFMERILPYDPTHPIDELQTSLKKYPIIEEQLKQKLKEGNDWTKRFLEGENVYFCVNNSTWKTHFIPSKFEVTLNFFEQNDIKGNFLVVNVNIH